jgi:predicted dehydrogenase
VHIRAGSPTHEELRWEINGSEGYLLLTDVTGVQVGQPRLFAAVGGNPLVEIERCPNDPDVPEGALTGPPLNVAHQYAALARAVRFGKSVVPDFHYAANRRLLLDALQKSSDTCRRVVL